MPADQNVPSLPPRTNSPPRNIPQSSYGPVAEKYGLQLPNGLQRKPFADACLNHATRPTESPAAFQPSSGPGQSCPLTDEYVIITKSDPRDHSEPQNIPRMGLASRPVQQGMEDYEMMRPAQLASIRGRKSPSPNPGTKVGENPINKTLIASQMPKKATAVSLCVLTLYQPMTHICAMSSHKPIGIYRGVLILGVNTLYRLFCFFRLFLVVGEELIDFIHHH